MSRTTYWTEVLTLAGRAITSHADQDPDLFCDTVAEVCDASPLMATPDLILQHTDHPDALEDLHGPDATDGDSPSEATARRALHAMADDVLHLIAAGMKGAK